MFLSSSSSLAWVKRTGKIKCAARSGAQRAGGGGNGEGGHDDQGGYNGQGRNGGDAGGGDDHGGPPDDGSGGGGDGAGDGGRDPAGEEDNSAIAEPPAYQCPLHDGDTWNRINDAILNVDHENVQQCVHEKTDPSQRLGRRLLYLAAMYSTPDFLETLVKAGAAGIDEALEVAAARSNQDVVECLIKHAKAKVRNVGFSGETVRCSRLSAM